MNIDNHLPFTVDVRAALDRDGYECAALMLKATYLPPGVDQPRGSSAQVAAEQLPWVHADIDDGGTPYPLSLYEAELPQPKPQAEYLLLGQVHGRDGKAQTHLPAQITIGTHRKRLVATGPRRWQAGRLGGKAQEPAPVRSVPLSYALAFGGCDPTCQDPGEGWFDENPAGRGHCGNPRHPAADGMPLPQIEPLQQRFDAPCKHFPVLGLGPVGRNWTPRLRWAGTYDEAWKRDTWPDLPADFDSRFLQCAAPDQWLPELRGGEIVCLHHFTAPDSRFGPVLEFALPPLEYFATVHLRHGSSTRVQLRPDTLMLEPEEGRLCVIARQLFPLREGLHEIEAVDFGEPAHEQLAPRVPTFIDLDDFIDQLRSARPPAPPPPFIQPLPRGGEGR